MIMTATVVDIGTLITRGPEIRGGRPCIAGTGVIVQRIVGWYKLGLSPGFFSCIPVTCHRENLMPV